MLLTNDSSYWKVPTPRDTVDADFRVHEGRERSRAHWRGRLGAEFGNGEGTEKSPIQIRGSYRLRWREYSNFPGKSYGSFRYLAVSVE